MQRIPLDSITAKCNEVPNKVLREQVLAVLTIAKEAHAYLAEKQASSLSIDADDFYSRDFDIFILLINNIGNLALILQKTDEKAKDEADKYLDSFLTYLETIKTVPSKLIEKFTKELESLRKAIKTQKLLTISIMPISLGCPDFKDIASFRSKTSGANPGVDITIRESNGTKRTYTVKQGKNIGNTIAENFIAQLTRNMVGIEPQISAPAPLPEPRALEAAAPSEAERKGKEKIVKEDKDPKKESKKIIKTIIAPAYLVLRASDIKPATPIAACRQQLWVASEWSQDKASFEACKIFGLEKRISMAGTFQTEVFNQLRELNQRCQLGLEAVLIAATYTGDFDLHLENFMLKFNTQHVPEKDMRAVNLLIGKFEDIITKRKEIKKEDYLEVLVSTIDQIKYLGVEVYFHKIDHDSGGYRYTDPERKVDFSTHRTSPVRIQGGKIITQPTLHITELTGTEGEGIDQLLLSESAIHILQNNPLDKQMETIRRVASILFDDIHRAVFAMTHLNSKGRVEAEYELLNQFYFHLTGNDIPFNSELPAKKLIKDMQDNIREALDLGTVYKINDLQIQLYKRIQEKESKEGKLPESQKAFKSFLATELERNLVEYLYQQWSKIYKQYNAEISYLARPSEESKSLVAKISQIYQSIDTSADPIGEKRRAFHLMQEYVEKYSGKRLSTIIKNTVSPFCQIPINDPIFLPAKAEGRQKKIS